MLETPSEREDQWNGQGLGLLSSGVHTSFEANNYFFPDFLDGLGPCGLDASISHYQGVDLALDAPAAESLMLPGFYETSNAEFSTAKPAHPFAITSPGTNGTDGISSSTITPATVSPSSDTLSPGSASLGTAVDQAPDKTSETWLQVVPYVPQTSQKPSAVGSQAKKSQDKQRKSRVVAARKDVMKVGKVQKVFEKKDAHGNIIGTAGVFGLDQIVRVPANPDQKRATTKTRKKGACPRCQEQKWRCDPSESQYEPCGRCMKLVFTFYSTKKEKAPYQPCLRLDFSDLWLHRKGPMIRNEIPTWFKEKARLLYLQEDTDTHEIYLTQGFGEGPANALRLTVSRFTPVEGDRTKYFWTDPSGEHRSMEMPPYFISDLEAARHSVRNFIVDARSAYVDSLLGESNPIIRQTFQTALFYTAFNNSNLINLAFESWVTARLIESHWRIFHGGNQMGAVPTNEPGHPYDGFIPVTPIMDTQLDDLIIREVLAPLSKEFLGVLKKKIDERKKENWLEVYLGLFIAMSNMGWVLKDMVAMATWKGLKTGSRGGTLTQSFMHACKAMLAHFHFACAGAMPLYLTLKPTSNDKTPEGLTNDQIEYLQFIQGELLKQEKIKEWRKISMYDDDGYWCYQLLCKEWRGDIPHAGELDDYREEDFLSSSTT